MKNLFSTFFIVFVGINLSAQTQNISFSHGGCTFQGELDLPAGNGPHPAIVLIPGSGQNDRHSTMELTPSPNVNCLYPGLVGQTLYPLRDLGKQLSDSGYAVLRYDELFISCPNYSGVRSFENVFLPGLSALDYLKTRPDIDTNQLILAGHSEGAMLISVMANMRNDVKALISIAGSRTPFDSIFARQLVDIVDSCGGDMATAVQQGQQFLTYFNMVRQQNYGGLPPFGGLQPQEWNPYINAADSVAILYDQAQLPALFLGFGKDFNVPPLELVRFQQETTGNHNFFLIPGLNHSLTPINSPDVPQFVGDTIVYWLRNASLSANSFAPIKESQVKVFPNPTQGVLSLSAKCPIEKVEVINLTGRVVERASGNQSQELQIDMIHQPKGMYFLSIQYVDGVVERVKVVVR